MAKANNGKTNNTNVTPQKISSENVGITLNDKRRECDQHLKQLDKAIQAKVEAEREMKKAQDEKMRVAAELYVNGRKNPQSLGLNKPSEESIRRAISDHEKMKKAQSSVSEKQPEYSKWRDYVALLFQRGEMLKDLIDEESSDNDYEDEDEEDNSDNE